MDIEIRVGDARSTLGSGRWDLVFLDPPYADDPATWVRAAAGSASAVLVIEHRTGRSVPTSVGSLERVRQRRYGDTTLSVYEVRSSDV